MKGIFYFVVLGAAVLCAVNINAAPSVGHFDDMPSNNSTTRPQFNISAAAVFTVKKYECFVNALGKVSRKLQNLTALWAFSEKRFRTNVANWKSCSNFETLAGPLCNLKQSTKAYILIREYLKIAERKNQYFQLRLMPQYAVTCLRPKLPSTELPSVTPSPPSTEPPAPTTDSNPIEEAADANDYDFDTMLQNIFGDIEATD